VLSDLHLPNPKSEEARRVVAALIAMKVRLVVITGDHTNGNKEDHKRTFRGEGWEAVLEALQPLHDAGIAVLPVAGNHDSYTDWQSAEYAQAFKEIETWVSPLTLSRTSSMESGPGHAHAPFSYSVDVDGVHFSLAHLVSQSVEPEVATWLKSDLDAAASAKHRIVFGHVPMVSVISQPHPLYLRQLGTILEREHADMLVMGHEHVVWDEDVTLPAGGKIREVLVGCSSGAYVFGPSEKSRLRANCTPIVDPSRREPMRCTMPHGGGVFEIHKRRKNRFHQHARTTFTLFEVDGDDIDVRPMTIDRDGRPLDFYLDRR
jgi:predicted phosphodiesterase